MINDNFFVVDALLGVKEKPEIKGRFRVRIIDTSCGGKVFWENEGMRVLQTEYFFPVEDACRIRLYIGDDPRMVKMYKFQDHISIMRREFHDAIGGLTFWKLIWKK